MKNTVLHRAHTRGDADHGWLHSRHTFSFANYYNPKRVHFGALRVLNDDTVAPGMGFGSHPHDNMEIISIPLEGDLEHQDSMGNTYVVKTGDVQVMSAGSGITHSEYNKNKDQVVKFLQIWIFPNEKNIKPRYDQMTIQQADNLNRFNTIISPDKSDGKMWIQQDAWIHVSKFEKNHSQTYTLNQKNNGIYIFILDGQIRVDDQVLENRDGYGIWDVEQVEISAINDANFIIMEVPML